MQLKRSSVGGVTFEISSDARKRTAVDLLRSATNYLPGSGPGQDAGMCIQVGRSAGMLLSRETEIADGLTVETGGRRRLPDSRQDDGATMIRSPSPPLFAAGSYDTNDVPAQSRVPTDAPPQ